MFDHMICGDLQNLYQSMERELLLEKSILIGRFFDSRGSKKQ